MAIYVKPVRFRDLETIIAVAESRSFRGASRTLVAEPSTISRTVRSIEERLGISLFERDRSGVRLTGAGQEFYREILEVVNRFNQACSAAAMAGRGSKGSVTMGVAGSISRPFIGRLLRTYSEAHPEVRLRLKEGGYHEHLAGLADRSLDIAFIVGAQIPADFDSHRLWSERIVAAIQSNDILATQAELPFSAFRDARFIVSAAAPGPEIHDYIIQAVSNQSFRPEIVIYDVGREGLMSMVELGFGVSLACRSETRIAYPGVAFIPIEGHQVLFSVVWSAQNDNPAFRRLLSLTRRLALDEGGVSS